MRGQNRKAGGVLESALAAAVHADRWRADGNHPMG